MDNLKGITNSIFKSIIGKFLFSTVGLIVIAVALVLIIIISVISGSDDMGSGPLLGEGKKLPESVLIWKDDVAEVMEKHDLDEKYLYVLLSIMKQESNGDVLATNGDIFQSSESKCGYIGCITDPLESIDQAVVHFKKTVTSAKDNLEVSIASYNFGNGFATWTQKNHDNQWTLDIAIEFSQYMMTKVSDPTNYTCIRKEAKPHGACYGDIMYVPAIMSYLSNNEHGEIEIDGEFNAPVSPMIITSEFGMRIHPIHGDESQHNGMDFSCTGGVSKISTVMDGIVVHADWMESYGNTVIVKHEEGLFTHYAHLSSITVSTDDDVTQGQNIAICGSTGDSTGPHLHFEVKTEMWSGHVNPQSYFTGL